MQDETPTNPKTAAAEDPGHSMFSRPIMFSIFIIICLVGAFIFQLRTVGIFGCPAYGYDADRYLAYCNTTAYGDYDHGAFWLGLEPSAERSAALADTLFVGSSQMQFAFSTIATHKWFDVAGARFYLLGFSHTENVVFTKPLLERLEPVARSYVINVGGFFEDRVTQPAAALLRDDDVTRRYRNRRLWQRPHQIVCGYIAAICGENLAFYRRYENGDWVLNGSGDTQQEPVADERTEDRSKWPRSAQIAEQFISTLPVPRHCVILTIAPSASTPIDEARALADTLGMTLISPRPPELMTFDGIHLDPRSAEKWSAAFFEAAGDRLRDCLGPADADPI